MSQALDRLRAMVSLPKYFSPMPLPPTVSARGEMAPFLAGASSLDLILDQRGADMADLPGGASGMLVRDYKRKEAGRLVTRIDPGVVAMAAKLRGPERQAAEKLERWKTALAGVPGGRRVFAARVRRAGMC
jgi:hypothetical protein